MDQQFPPWLRYATAVTALALIAYEAVIYPGEPRWALLVVYTAMLGIPTLIGQDRGQKGQTPPTPPGPPVGPNPKEPPG